MRPVHLLTCVLVLSVMSPLVFADGGFFFLTGEAALLAQTQQEVVIAFHRGAGGTDQATYVLRTRYSGEPGELAWVVPVPVTPTNVVAHANDRLFDSLERATEPSFTIIPPYHDGITCGCGGLATESAGTPNGLVTVEASGQAGIFEWASLTSTGSTALLTWLNENGFALPAEADAILDGYIQQDMHFLTIRVDEPGQIELGDDDEIAIPPIQFTCETSMRFYPMAISRVSAASQTEVLIYIWADHRARAANMPNGTIDPNALAYDARSPSSTNYEALFTAKVDALGGAALITEYAGSYRLSSLSGWSGDPWPAAPAGVASLTYLTRLRTVIDRQDMTFDYTFENAPNDDSVSNQFTVSMPDEAAASLGGQALVVVLLFAGLRALLRRARPLR